MRDPSYVFKDAVDELFQGCGAKIPRQIFLPIFDRDTPCNYWPRGTGSRGRQACILFKIISFIFLFFIFLLLQDMGGGGGNPRALLYRATINPIRSGYQMNPIPLELRGFATFMLIFPTLLCSTTRRVPRTRDGALCDYSIFEGYPCSSKQDLAQPPTMSGSFCRKLLKIKQKKPCF